MSRAARVALAGALATSLACGGGDKKTPPAGRSTAGSTHRTYKLPDPGAKAPPDPALFARIARGELGLVELVDTGRGLIYVAVFEDVRGDHPQAGEDGLVRVAERLCGQRIWEIGSLVEERLGANHDAPPLTCSGLECVKPARAEYDLDTTFVFIAEGGRYLLDRVVQIEGGTMTEDFTREARAWAEGEVKRLASGRCLPRSGG